VVGKKKRQSRAVPLLGSHQKCWIWGKHVVLEILRAGRWQPWEVHLDRTLLEPETLAELEQLLDRNSVPGSGLTGDQIARLCGARDHQGLIAKMPPFPYASEETALQLLHSRSAVLVLAGIQDPFNFGSILRSADLFGLEAIFVPRQGQAAVSAHVARSSAGAVNYLEIAAVDDLPATCRQLRRQGLQLLAATEKGTSAPAGIDLQRASAMIIGNEGTGIPQPLLSLCDHQVCIPLSGHVGSLNAAVAAGILCYELHRQRLGSSGTDG